MLIQAVNVSKVFKNGLTALDNINLNIDVGEFVFLTGQSGAGISTLIRLMFREDQPTSGKILIAGRSISRLTERETVALRRNSGVVFQDFRLLEKNTVFDNVAIALKAIEVPKEQIKLRVPEVLEQVGLAGREKDPVINLSGGERQRVAVARAIVNKPMILYADEPTGDLDPQTSMELMQLFVEINKNKTAVIMATHDREIVNHFKKRVVTLASGCIVGDRQGGFRL